MAMLSDAQLNSLNKDALVFIASSLQEQISSMQAQLDNANAQIAENNKQIKHLIEQISLLNQHKFGRSSEKASDQCDGQLTIYDVFNEAEGLKKPDLPEPTIQEITVGSHSRKKKSVGKREEDLSELPKRIIPHEIPEEELNKLFPNGYKELPIESYQRLSIIPETFIVDEHQVHVYAAKDNSGKIVRAPRSTDLFRNSIATSPLLSSVITGKFANAIPIERQVKIFKTNGINLSSNTLSNWVIKSSELYLSLVYDQLHKLIYDSKVIHADETPVKVMKIDGEKIKHGKKTYMWVYCSKPDDSSHPIVLYDWQPSRKADHPREFLKDYHGIAVTDGYQVYHTIANERTDLKIAGCWVHARRPFAEFIKSIGDKLENGTIAHEAYKMITEIMHLDNTLDDLSVSDRTKQRQLVLKGKVDAYFDWVKLKYTQVTRNSVIGRALAYSINQEKYLRVFLEDCAVPMDNNRAEQAIRPFTIGRKNFVLIDSSNGAKASAVLYSLTETAKANQLNVYKYFELLLTEIPKHMQDGNLNFLEELLPWTPAVQESCASKYKKS